MLFQSKAEKKYRERLKIIKGSYFKSSMNSVTEGFEYFSSETFKNTNPEKLHDLIKLCKSVGIKKTIKLLVTQHKYMPSIKKSISKSFQETKIYLKELQEFGHIKSGTSLFSCMPNNFVWRQLKNYAWDKWKVKIGFTELPEDLIFKGKAVLFKYVLVCIQEMAEENIEKAPKLQAGIEMQRVCNSLGLAVNDIADWMRKSYSIKCQTNHPFVGLINVAPLAGKAGMGCQGMDGLLITPEFGKRNCIAPIFIYGKYFEYTDNQEYEWIENFCLNCRICQTNCPAQAIYLDRKIINDSLDGLTIKTCIDREKCFSQFTVNLGCSICIKVCPFSSRKYDKIKQTFLKK